MKLLRFHSYVYPEILAATHLVNDLYTTFENADILTEAYAPTLTRGIDEQTRKKYKKIKYEKLYNGALILRRFAMFREGKNTLLRALRYFLCSIVWYHKGRRAKDIDVVYSSSTPPTQGVLCAKVAKKLSKKYGRKVPFIYNLQDVFPDSLVTTGLAKKNGLLWKIGRKIENYTYSHADKIIVISEGMKKNIMDKGVPEEKIEVISNWIDTNAVKPVLKEDNRLFEEYGISREKFVVVYAGNVGKAQGAGVIVDAAEILRDNADVQFVIFGGGAAYDDVKKSIADKALTNVIITPLLPVERVSEVYSLGDAALITCKKGVGASGLPSKTWSIMACNTPIIAAFDTDSDLADAINKANAGVCVEPEDAEALAEAILTASKAEVRECGARAYVEKYASKEVCTAKYVEVLKSVI